MSNVCGRCRHPMLSHDDHASCPQCRIAAGVCHVDVDNPCFIRGEWTSKQWNKLRRSLVDARARTSQRGRQHWTSAFPRLEAWIISKPAPSATSSGPASEISSVVSGDDLSDGLLVSTSSPLAQQDLVVQVQNGVNMASSTASTAPARPLTAGPSTPGTIPIVPIVVPLGAQGMLSVTGTSSIPIQTARPVVSTNQRTMQSTALPYTALPYSLPAMPYLAMPSMAMPYSAMSSVLSARPYPMGYYGQGNQSPIMPNPGWMSEREQMLQHQLLQEWQQFEAWRASQAQPRPQPPISSRGFQLRLRMMLRSFQ